MKTYKVLVILWAVFFTNVINCISYKKALDIGKRAYIYAYPLVTMVVTRDIMTDNGKLTNKFTHVSKFPDYTFKDIVRPNVDTAYSFAWLDLSRGPVLLSVPETEGRYYLIQCLDAWTNVFASIGKRTTGTHAQQYLFVGPNFDGTVPAGMHTVESPTNMVLLLGRTQVNGKADYAAVKKIQQGYTLTRVAAMDGAQRTDLTSLTTSDRGNVKTALNKSKVPVDVVDALNAYDFFTLFARELKNNPSAPRDKAMVADLKNIGIIIWQEFDPACLGAKTNVLDGARLAAQKEIIHKKDNLPRVNGWGVMRNIGIYFAHYLTRAMVAHIGIGANVPEDALYPTAFVDGNGNILTGKNKYVIHFDKGQLPPANAFWSITLYNSESFLVKNELNRYALGDRDKLAFNADGSLDIYIQHNSPGKEKESNWLPAPEGEFNVTMRIYWPQESVIDGSWNPPALNKII